MTDSSLHDAAGQGHEPVSVKLYAIIGSILVVGTVLAFVFADRLQLSWIATVFLIFGVATFKVLLVALYFMHLKFEGSWKWILTVPPLILFVGLVMALLPDIAGLGRYG